MQYKMFYLFLRDLNEIEEESILHPFYDVTYVHCPFFIMCMRRHAHIRLCVYVCVSNCVCVCVCDCLCGYVLSVNVKVGLVIVIEIAMGSERDLESLTVSQLILFSNRVFLEPNDLFSA